LVQNARSETFSALVFMHSDFTEHRDTLSHNLSHTHTLRSRRPVKTK